MIRTGFCEPPLGSRGRGNRGHLAFGALLDVHASDDPVRIESIVKKARFDSWQAVVDFVRSYGIDVDEVAGDMHRADPAADTTALSGFIWGMALALKIVAHDPGTAAVWIARGLGDFTLPGSPAWENRVAEGYGKFVSLLLQRWINPMAIIGSQIPDGYVEECSQLAKQAAQLRSQTWDVFVLCRKDDLQGMDGLKREDGYLHAETEFVREPGLLRVSRSTAVHRPSDSPPVVYSVSTVEEGVAILDFERANLCIALSDSEAALFAHPIAGIYTRQARGSGRLVRAVAVQSQEIQPGCEDFASRASAHMVHMYADFGIHAVSQDATRLHNLGFPGISALGAIKATMTFAHRVAGALPR